MIKGLQYSDGTKQTLKIETKPLEAYRNICKHLDYDNDDYMFNGNFQEDNAIVEPALKILDILAHNFIWVEDGKIFIGLPYDCEIELTKDEFESDEEYELVKRGLENEKL